MLLCLADIPTDVYKRQELSSQAMADVICDDTGVKKYQFNSCHNITEKQFKEGITYVNLMKENANVLKKALNVK